MPNNQTPRNAVRTHAMTPRFKLVKTVDGGTVLVKADNVPPVSIRAIIDAIATKRNVTLYKGK